MLSWEDPLYPVISSVFSNRIAALLLLRSHVARFARLELLVKSATSIQAAWRRRVQMGKYKAWRAARPSQRRTTSHNLITFCTFWFDLIRFADLMKLFVMFPELSDPQALRLFMRHVQAILRGSHLESFPLKVFILSYQKVYPCVIYTRQVSACFSMMQMQHTLCFDKVANSPEAIWCDRGHTSRTNETDK